jgi:hypothetical protein
MLLSDFVERLASLAETMASTGGPMARSRRPTRAAGGSLTERVAERVATLTDDARVRAYEILGDRPRAVEIMERRLLDRKTGVRATYDEAHIPNSLDRRIQNAQERLRAMEELRAVIVRPMSPAAFAALAPVRKGASRAQ